MAVLKYNPKIWLYGLRKTMKKKIVRFAKFECGYFSDTKVEVLQSCQLLLSSFSSCTVKKVVCFEWI
jgi:hypothetical protein